MLLRIIRAIYCVLFLVIVSPCILFCIGYASNGMKMSRCTDIPPSPYVLTEAPPELATVPPVPFVSDASIPPVPATIPPVPFVDDRSVPPLPKTHGDK